MGFNDVRKTKRRGVKRYRCIFISELNTTMGAPRGNVLFSPGKSITPIKGARQEEYTDSIENELLDVTAQGAMRSPPPWPPLCLIIMNTTVSTFEYGGYEAGAEIATGSPWSPSRYHRPATRQMMSDFGDHEWIISPFRRMAMHTHGIISQAQAKRAWVEDLAIITYHDAEKSVLLR